VVRLTLEWLRLPDLFGSPFCLGSGNWWDVERKALPTQSVLDFIVTSKPVDFANLEVHQERSF